MEPSSDCGIHLRDFKVESVEVVAGVDGEERLLVTGFIDLPRPPGPSAPGPRDFRFVER